MEVYKRIIIFFNRKKLDYLFVFFLFLFLFFLIYLFSNKTITLDDSYFHIKYSQLLRQNDSEAVNNFQWIYFSDQARTGMRYYVSLFHYVLIPFTYFPNLLLGIKFFGIFSASLIMLGIYWWLKKIKIRKPLLLVLFFWSLCPMLFVTRLFSVRPLVLMIFIILLEIYCLWQKKYWRVFLLAILHIFDHSMTFYLPLFLAGVFFIFDYLHNKKFDWLLIFAAFLGTIGGMATMPNFPANFLIWGKSLVSIYRAVWQPSAVIIPEGAELYGFNVFDFIYQNYIFIGIIIFFFIIRIFYYMVQTRSRVSEEERLSFFETEKSFLVLADTLFLINLAFFLGFLLTKRVMDIWLPVIFIYMAVMLKIFLPILKFEIEEKYKRIVKGASVIFLIVMVFYLVGARIFALNKYIASQSSPEIFQGSAEWLKNNTKPGDIVFIDNWSSFPLLFYYNTKDYYIMGMEPRFLYDYDRELYLYWYNIVANGFPCGQTDCHEWNDEIKNKSSNEAIKILDKDVAKVIFNRFKSQYISMTVNSGNFYAIMKNSEYFTQVYQDPNYKNFSVFKINIDKL